MSGQQMRAYQEGMASLHAAPVGAGCSSHSHLGDTCSTHAPADHGHGVHHSQVGNTIAARQRAQQNQIKTLEDKFSQTLAKYITTYRTLGEEITTNAINRSPLARYAGQVITGYGSSDVSGDGGHCAHGGYSIINQANGRNWCCGPKENILHASTPGPGGVRTATCKPGGISYESSAYKNARYINSFGYAQALGAHGLTTVPTPSAPSSRGSIGASPVDGSGTHGASPGTHGSSPGAHGSSPGAHGSSPGAHGSSPGAHGSSPGAHGSSPGTHGSSPSAHSPSAAPAGTGSGAGGSTADLAGEKPGKCPAWSTSGKYTWNPSEWGGKGKAEVGGKGWVGNGTAYNSTACAWLSQCANSSDKATCVQQCPVALGIAYNESKFNPIGQSSDTYGRGLWQFGGPQGPAQSRGFTGPQCKAGQGGKGAATPSGCTAYNPLFSAHLAQKVTNNGKYWRPKGAYWNSCGTDGKLAAFNSVGKGWAVAFSPSNAISVCEAAAKTLIPSVKPDYSNYNWNCLQGAEPTYMAYNDTSCPGDFAISTVTGPPAQMYGGRKCVPPLTQADVAPR